MNNLPLQPLVWDWSYGDGGKTNAVCRAKSPSHEYIIRLESGGDCYVDYRKFDNDEDSDNRKDEAPVFDSIKAAQDWVQFTHYPSKMQPYVVPSQTWFNYETEQPSQGDSIVIAWVWMGDKHTIWLESYRPAEIDYLDDCLEVYWSFSPFEKQGE